MAGWTLEQDSSRHRMFVLVNEKQDSVILDWFAKPRRLAPTWIPRAVKYSDTEWRGMEKQPVIGSSNCPGLYHSIQVWDQKAVDTLLPLIEKSVEVLPLISDVGKFCAINVLEVVGCLDHGQSKLARSSDGWIVAVDEYIFKPGCLEGKHIFRLGEDNYSRLYVSDLFKWQAEKAGLIGLLFEKVWD